MQPWRTTPEESTVLHVNADMHEPSGTTLPPRPLHCASLSAGLAEPDGAGDGFFCTTFGGVALPELLFSIAKAEAQGATQASATRMTQYRFDFFMSCPEPRVISLAC